MKICVLKESLCIGGTERSAANISRIISQNNEVKVLLYDGRDIKYPYGGELIDIGVPATGSVAKKVINTVRRYFRVKKQLKINGIDIVYEFLSVGNPLSYLRYNMEKKIISARDFGKMSTSPEKYHAALRNADAMVCNSEYLKDFYLSKYPKDKHKVFAVYNVIEAEEIREQAKETVEESFEEFVKAHGRTVVSVGRFCKEKGFELLIEAISRGRDQLEGLGLVLVGDGTLRAEYEAIIEKNGLEGHVYFTGYQRNPYKYMARCDCFVLSSVSEGFPNVLAEAIAIGLPVISTNCYSGPAEILRADHDYAAVTSGVVLSDYGILVSRVVEDNKPQTVADLSDAMVKLMSDSELMKKYSLLSRERVKDFSGDAALYKIESIFQALKQ